MNRAVIERRKLAVAEAPRYYYTSDPIDGISQASARSTPSMARDSTGSSQETYAGSSLGLRPRSSRNHDRLKRATRCDLSYAVREAGCGVDAEPDDSDYEPSDAPSVEHTQLNVSAAGQDVPACTTSIDSGDTVGLTHLPTTAQAMTQPQAPIAVMAAPVSRPTAESVQSPMLEGLRRAIRDNKIFCTHWVRFGRCDYMTQPQGCRYKHEMSAQALEQCQCSEMPRWWLERHALNTSDKPSIMPALARGNPRLGVGQTEPHIVAPHINNASQTSDEESPGTTDRQQNVRQKTWPSLAVHPQSHFELEPQASGVPHCSPPDTRTDLPAGLSSATRAFHPQTERQDSFMRGVQPTCATGKTIDGNAHSSQPSLEDTFGSKSRRRSPPPVYARGARTRSRDRRQSRVRYPDKYVPDRDRSRSPRSVSSRRSFHRSRSPKGPESGPLGVGGKDSRSELQRDASNNQLPSIDTKAHVRRRDSSASCGQANSWSSSASRSMVDRYRSGAEALRKDFTRRNQSS